MIGKKMGFLGEVKNKSLLDSFNSHAKIFFTDHTVSLEIYKFKNKEGKEYLAFFRNKRGADDIWIYVDIGTEKQTEKLLDSKTSLLEYISNRKEFYLAYIKNDKLRNIRKLDIKNIPKTYIPRTDEFLENKENDTKKE